MDIPEDLENKKRKLSSPKDETDDKRLKRDSTEESPMPKARIKDLTKSEKVTIFLPLYTREKFLSSIKRICRIFTYLNKLV